MTDNQPENSVYRILDAAFNRAAEGIRVVEDYLRLAVGDAFLSSQLKSLRHKIAQAARGLDLQNRVGARDSQSDVGRNIQTKSEYQRQSPTELVQANLARAQQALRTIEEFSKTLSDEVAHEVEQLRYDAYTLEKSVLTGMLSATNLAKDRLYVLITGGRNIDEMCAQAKDLSKAGVTLLQLRDKRLTDRQLVTAGKALTSAIRGTGARWIMNDRVDLAVAANADGVHLGQDDMKVADARQIIGAAKLIGVSTHDLEQAQQAVIEGANYIGVGPVFPSSTKSFEEFPGLAFVRQVAEHITLPAFAIGGIGIENINLVCQAGLFRAAVQSSIVRSNRPDVAAADMIQTILENETNSQNPDIARN